MILLAALYRLFDGLPLSASTDVDNGTAVKECQRYIKLISKKLTHLPDRCSLTLLQHHIHLISSLDVTILMLCEASYPTVLAFSFLDELQKEFILLYDKGKVHDAKRPYAFIEFDSVISKTKQRFNSPRSLSTKYNLAEKSQEIRLRPPYQIQEEDLQMSRNGLVERSTYRPTVTPGRRYVPLTVLGWTAVILCAFSSFLSLARAMAIVGQGHLNEYVDGSPYYYGALFFISSMGNVCQLYLLRYFKKWRKLIAFILFLLMAVVNLILWELRSLRGMLFHVSVASFATFKIFTRQLQEKLPGYSV